MKLDRNIVGKGGRGKYALVLMRNYPKPDAPELAEVQHALRCLERNGMMDYGEAHGPSEFFLVRLKDRFAQPALQAYADEARMVDPEWAHQVDELTTRAGTANRHCKTPD